MKVRLKSTPWLLLVAVILGAPPIALSAVLIMVMSDWAITFVAFVGLATSAASTWARIVKWALDRWFPQLYRPGRPLDEAQLAHIEQMALNAERMAAAARRQLAEQEAAQ